MRAWAKRNVWASVILIVLALLVMLIGITAFANRASCAWYGYQTERDTRYAAFVGCMVNMPSGWTPRTEIRTAQ